MSDHADDAVRLAGRLGLAVPAAEQAAFRATFARLLDQAELVLALGLTLPGEEGAAPAPFEP